jgi:hypothetical protein
MPLQTIREKIQRTPFDVHKWNLANVPRDDAAPSAGKDPEVTETSTYPLRLPRSLKKAVEKQSEEDGTSINQFVATAVAEKLSALQVAESFTKRNARADFKDFDKITKRRRGKPPRTGDEMPR